MRMSVAGDGLTEPNLYFAIGKMQTDPDSPPIKKATQRVAFFIGIGIQKEGFEESNATWMSVARSGLTERNIYFANGKMQTDPDSPPT